jgi:hypothetical protein
LEGLGVSLRYNIKLPKVFENRKSISAAEFNSLLSGGKKKRVKKPRPRKQDKATFKNGVLIITIYMLPPSQNEWTNWHEMKLSKEKVFWNQLIIALARNKCLMFKNPVVKFKFYFPDNIDRDRKNYESWKPLMDGLTRAGIISDDNWKEIKEDPSDIEVDRANPRTEIIVREG